MWEIWSGHEMQTCVLQVDLGSRADEQVERKKKMM